MGCSPPYQSICRQRPPAALSAASRSRSTELPWVPNGPSSSGLRPMTQAPCPEHLQTLCLQSHQSSQARQALSRSLLT